jgi:hypothetical protein
LLLGAIQVAIVLSLGGKLLYDRATRPRVWVLSQVYDPDLPIRGRYLSELLRIPAEGFAARESRPPNHALDWYENRGWAYFEIHGNGLVAKPAGTGSGAWVHVQTINGATVAMTEEPVLFFIPDNAKLPTLRPGEELWVEVTIPAKGPPRPIRVGVKRNGVITPVPL